MVERGAQINCCVGGWAGEGLQEVAFEPRARFGYSRLRQEWKEDRDTAKALFGLEQM